MNRPKPFVLLAGKPIFVYTIETFEKCSLIDSIIIVGHKNHLQEIKKIIKSKEFKKIKKIIPGGKVRSRSVFNGLKELDCDTEMVVIHDGARPFVTDKTIKQSVKLCRRFPAVTTAVPVKPTIKRVNAKTLLVKETLDRNSLWEIQTPQVFQKDIIQKAHNNNRNGNPTDDASMVERLGTKVKILLGDYKNIKITTIEDLMVAKAFLNSKEKK